MNKKNKKILKRAEDKGLSDILIKELANGNIANNKLLLKELKKELGCRIVGL